MNSMHTRVLGRATLCLTVMGLLGLGLATAVRAELLSPVTKDARGPRNFRLAEMPGSEGDTSESIVGGEEPGLSELIFKVVKKLVVLLRKICEHVLVAGHAED